MSTSSSRDSGVLKIALIILAVVLLGPFLLMALAVPMMGYGGGMMGGGMMGYGGMMGGSSGVFGLFGFLLQLLWLVVVIGAVVLGYRWLRGQDAVGSEPALEELRLAYARGEITAEEFEERRTVLTGN